MRKIKIFLVAIVVTIIAGYPGYAQRSLESYVARLSERDHFNSNGQRLTTAAAIIRQDRANYHRFGIRDAEDEDDKFFADEGNRAILERLLEHGRAESGVISGIVNGNPLVRVEVLQGNDGPFIVVTLIGSSASVQEDASSPNTAGGEAYYYRGEHETARRLPRFKNPTISIVWTANYGDDQRNAVAGFTASRKWMVVCEGKGNRR